MRIRLALFVLFFGGYVFATSDSLTNARTTLSSAMRATRANAEVIAGNMANFNTTSTEPGGQPYRGKILSSKTVKDPETGALITVYKVIDDTKTPLREEYNPSHPGADPVTGIVLFPNVELPMAIADSAMARTQASAQAQMFQQLNVMNSDLISAMKA